MEPTHLCHQHLEQYREMVGLAKILHAGESPWHGHVEERLEALIRLLDSFNDVYKCCRRGDRFGQLCCELMGQIYREHLAGCGQVQLRRNLKRRAYELTWVFNLLVGNLDVLAYGYSRPATGFVLEAGSRLERHLHANGEDLSLVAASLGLSQYVAMRRELETHHWGSYVLTTQDAALLRTYGDELRPFAIRDVAWLGTSGPTTATILGALRWLDLADSGLRSTVEVLGASWQGSIDELLSASHLLSRADH